MRYAGFWKRLWAWSVDAMIIQIAVLAAGYVLPPQPISPEILNNPSIQLLLTLTQMTPEQLNTLMGGALNPSLVYLMLGLSAVYNIAFVVSPWRATPGKRWYNMQVVTRGGEPLSITQSTVRHFASAISALPVLLGFVLAAIHKEKAALHDIIAGTRVVYKEEA